MTAPELTVVLMVDRRRERGQRALRALLDQTAIERLSIRYFDRIIIVNMPEAATQKAALESGEIDMALDITSDQVADLQATDGITVYQGSGNIVHFLLMNANPDVGGPMSNLKPGSLTGDAHFLMSFNHASATVSAGPVTLLPGNNSAYRRAAVLELGDDLLNLLEMEPLLNWRLVARGERLFLDTDMQMVHANEISLMAFVEANYVFSRLFGALRGGAQGWSPGERAVRVLVAPILPVVRAARLVRFAITRDPAVLTLVLLGLPVVLLIQGASVLGQTVGILFGEGRARQELLSLTLNAPRDEVAT